MEGMTYGRTMDINPMETVRKRDQIGSLTYQRQLEQANRIRVSWDSVVLIYTFFGIILVCEI